MNSDRCKEVLRQYSIAITSTIAATWTRFLLEPHLGDRVPFATYMIAVLFTAWLAGTRPAILTLVLGLVAVMGFSFGDAGAASFGIADVLALLTYGTVCAVAISLFCDTQRQHAITHGQLKQIEDLSRELQLADSRKDEFLALLAHELRNPLAPISAALALIEKTDATTTQESRAAVQMMRRQLDLLVCIVDDLLDVSRFVHRRVRIEKKPVDVRRIVDAAVEQTQPEIQRRQHDLQIVMPDDPIMVNGDHLRLVQVVTNLLSNAAKYTPREGRIQVLLDQDDADVTLQIVDNGIGIKPESCAHLFDLFARGDTATLRDQGGLGLGLPIAKEFTRMHDGTLQVFSEGIGSGSRFVLTLPLLDESARRSEGDTHSQVAAGDTETAAAEGSGADAPRAARAAGVQSPQKVLIVDDNRDAAETLGALLTFEGYQIRIAYDGCDGLRMSREFCPDVVLLDIGLPGMDGYEVARRLRAARFDRQPRIIAVTGWGGDDVVTLAQDAGFDDHLVKPVDPDRLLSMLRTPDVDPVGVS